MYVGRLASGGDLRAAVARKWRGHRRLCAELVVQGDELMCFQVLQQDDRAHGGDDGMDGVAKALEATGSAAILFELLDTYVTQQQQEDGEDSDAVEAGKALVCIPLGVCQSRADEFFL
jgi:hypothetical protein